MESWWKWSNPVFFSNSGQINSCYLRRGKFQAAANVRSSHDAGAILKASYGAAKATGQADLAKVIKESAIDPNAASKAAEGLTAKSKHKNICK